MKLLKGAYSLEEAVRLLELIGYYADGGFYSLMEYGEKKWLSMIGYLS